MNLFINRSPDRHRETLSKKIFSATSAVKKISASLAVKIKISASLAVKIKTSAVKKNKNDRKHHFIPYHPSCN
jgi:hypothetical protein